VPGHDAAILVREGDLTPHEEFARHPYGGNIKGAPLAGRPFNISWVDCITQLAVHWPPKHWIRFSRNRGMQTGILCPPGKYPLLISHANHPIALEAIRQAAAERRS
jgi:hypothetical protein